MATVVQLIDADLGVTVASLDGSGNLVQSTAGGGGYRLKPAINVVNFVTSEPATPNVGDRYINSVTGNTSATAQAVVADEILIWNGTDWTRYTPENGIQLYVTTPAAEYEFKGGSWAIAPVTHTQNSDTKLDDGQPNEVTSADLRAHIDSTANPHSVTKSQVGLGNVDNTADSAKPVSTAHQTALDGKVDDAQVLTNVPAGAVFTDTQLSDAQVKTAYENNANTNEFSDAEKSKLAGLESSKFLGEYATLGALQTAHPTPAVGSYANVDAGAASDVERYVWDSDDAAYILQLGVSTLLTDAQIKTQYENNANTNAFTDSDVTNLGNQSGTNTGDEVAASETVAGVAEIATQAETDAGTDDTRFVTPLKLAAYSGLGSSDDKAGNLLAGSFSGNPKTATVTFATAHADANYSIMLTPEVDNANASYVTGYYSKTAVGFTITMGTNSISNLVSVDWSITPYLDA